MKINESYPGNIGVIYITTEVDWYKRTRTLKVNKS